MRADETPIRFRGPAGWLAYSRAGTGPPVVLLHGLGTSRRTWRQTASRLSQTRTVIAVDLPGHGESDAPQGDYSPGAHAVAVRDLVTSLTDEPVDIVGHSLGGGITMMFARIFPELARSVVLISSGGLGPEVSPLLRAAALPGADHGLAMLSHLPDDVLRMGLRVLTALPGALSPHDAEPLQGALSTLENDVNRRTFVRTARSVIGLGGQAVRAGDQVDSLAARPVLLIWGADDRTIPPRHHRQLAARLPRAQQLEVPGAGHFPHETAPGVVGPAIEHFLN